MLSFTRSRVPLSKISQPFRRVSAFPQMADEDVRAHFKRLCEETREERIQKMKKFKKDELDSKELKLTILGNGSIGSPSNVVISSPKRSYIFNCGEGTQKLCMEYRVKLPRISNLFLTSVKWKNLGGLPGYLLTAQALGLPGIGLHGPRIVSQLLDSTQRFIKVEYLNVYHHEKEFFEDQVLRIQRVKLGRSSSESGDIRDEVYAYVCRGFDKPGKLLLEKCVEKGIPTGPLFSKLKSGQEITLENGDVVKPSDVMEPNLPGPVVIVLECPSEDYIDSLLASEAIAAHQNVPGNDVDYLATCVAHMTPQSVYQSEKYQKFLSLFPDTTNHLHLCEANTTSISTAAVRRITRLNQIHEGIFPMLPDPESESLPPMTTICLRQKSMLRDSRHDISTEKFADEARVSENFDGVRADFMRKLEGIRQVDKREYPKVTFLGTGSALPTKDRNVAGILVRSSKECAFLLDCGESTYNQMVLAFGPEKAVEILSQLKFIFISHIHADHHLGLIGVLLRRKQLGITDKLTVFAPTFLTPWLEQFSQDFEKVDCVHVNNRELLKNNPIPEKTLSELSVSRIATCYVDHCPESFGIRVDMSNYSLTYSGDTLPSENLVQLGKDCDLLIHEGTMEDELLADARSKSHSTISQAREIGRKMNAKFTLLTHFSQRYAKLPFMDEKIFADGRLGMAFDFMHVCPKNLHVLPHIYPMLKCIYCEHYVDLQEKSQKYIGRNQQLSVKF